MDQPPARSLQKITGMLHCAALRGSFSEGRSMWVGLLAGAITVGAVLLAVVGAVAWFVFGRREEKVRVQRVAESVPGGSARIIEIGSNSIASDQETAGFALRLEITPPTGDAYQTISRWIVKIDHYKDIRVGLVVPVRIDRLNPKIIYPEPKWALQPADFEYTEEDLTN